jgi:predicted esterase
MNSLLRRGLVLLAVGILSSASRAAEPTTATPVTPAPSSLFDYDRSAPLDVKDVGQEVRDGAVIHDITFNVAGKTVAAYLVKPEAEHPSYAGILYVHWLGEPATTNRTEFLNEAVALSGQGIVSVLVDTMWAKPKWYPDRIPEEDYDNAIRQVIELRRAMDLLLSQPKIDPKRIAFVGHDFGAMYGTVMGAVDKRPTTYVLMAAVPHFIDWFLFARKPKSIDDYRRQLAPLDPVNFVSQLAPAPVFFQFAAHDEYVSAAAAAEFYGSAQPRKQTATYDTHHHMRGSDVSADRVTWLIRMLTPATVASQ